MVAPAAKRCAKESLRKPMGRWLVENMPRGANLEIPGAGGSRREIPFGGGDAE